MYDKIVKLGGAVIQHGPLNDRIYLMKLGDSDPAEAVTALDKLAGEKDYSKITAKVPVEKTGVFEENGYRREAAIPGFFGGRGDAAILARYLDKGRQIESRAEEIKEILALADKKAAKQYKVEDISPLTLGAADLAGEAEQMSLVYREVFETYPFPIHDPDYLRMTMKSNVRYFYVRDGKRFVALSSAEMDPENGNVEMTDFATLPSHRGKGLAVVLLDRMEAAMKRRGLHTAYTIARSLSAGMNITFARLGYICGGTLTNNTNICGKIESMNIWYKSLD